MPLAHDGSLDLAIIQAPIGTEIVAMIKTKTIAGVLHHTTDNIPASALPRICRWFESTAVHSLLNLDQRGEMSDRRAAR